MTTTPLSSNDEDKELKLRIRDLFFSASGGISDMAEKETSEVMHLISEDRKAREAEIRIDELRMALKASEADSFPTDMLNVCSWIVKRLAESQPQGDKNE